MLNYNRSKNLLKKYPLTNDEIWLKNCRIAINKAIESLPFEKLFIYNDHIKKDDKINARNYLLSNACITEEEKLLLLSYYKYN